eukprot:gene514-1925_t
MAVDGFSEQQIYQQVIAKTYAGNSCLRPLLKKSKLMRKFPPLVEETTFRLPSQNKPYFGKLSS